MKYEAYTFNNIGGGGAL